MNKLKIFLLNIKDIFLDTLLTFYCIIIMVIILSILLMSYNFCWYYSFSILILYFISITIFSILNTINYIKTFKK